MVASAACSHKNFSAPSAPQTILARNSYTDLTPGSHIRIVVPLQGAVAAVAAAAPSEDGHTLVVSSPSVIGYRSFSYSVTGTANRGVRLKFASAETTIDGKTVRDAAALPLPFPLPKGSNHVRLVYLVRISSADHDMVILASKNIAALNACTKRLQDDPGVCGRHPSEVFCAAVPTDVAVRPDR